MSFADEVRAHCARRYIEPARKRGDATVSIRAGDVHDQMGYRNRYPLVCSALGAALFEQMCRIRRVSVEGPLNGANTTLKFKLLP
jgi:5-methylcytosine-specific restriction protein B